MTVIAFDTETWLIEPGLLAPPLVCLQWQVAGAEPRLEHRDRWAKQNIEHWLAGDAILVGHNVAYDMAVIAAQWPDLLPAIVAKYDRDQVTDTLIREQLIMISRGQFRSYADSDGELHGVKYSLADCVARHFGGRQLKKEGWRLFYRAFDGHSDVSTWDQVAAELQDDIRSARWPDWVSDYLARGIITQKDLDGLLSAAPEEAVEYALKDASTTLELYEDQERLRWT